MDLMNAAQGTDIDFAAETAGDQTILAVIQRNADRIADKPFLIQESKADRNILTFQGLQHQAGQFAAFFQSQGVKPGDTVALILNSHPSLSPAFVGAMRTGAVPFMMPAITLRQDPLIFWKAQGVTLERAGARLVLTEAVSAMQFETYLPHLADRLVDVDRIDHMADPRLPPAEVADRKDIAFLQHSSGTTGAKKGVIITHGMMLDFTDALSRAIEFRRDDIVASWLPLYHDMGLIGCLMLPMLLGVTTVHMDPFEWVSRPAALLEMIERHRATVCWQPNFAFQHLLRAVSATRVYDLSSMRAMIDCSEPCKHETLRDFRARFAKSGLQPEAVQVSYGMAENVFIATQTAMGAIPRAVDADLAAFKLGCIETPVEGAPSIGFLSTGHAIPGTVLSIIDEQGGKLPDRMVGEVVVESPYLFSGYFRSDLARDRLIDGSYRTGDFGFLDHGELFVCGRRDEMLIVNGKNLFANDIEFSINRGSSVKPGRCIAISPYNPRTGSQSLVIIAETDQPEPSDRDALAQAIQKLVLSEYGVIANRVMVVGAGWLIKSTSGKIARGANEAKYEEERLSS